MDKSQKIAILHRYPAKDIPKTNAAFPYFSKGCDVLTFKTFNRLKSKVFKSILWVFYAPLLVIGRRYDIIYCDDSFPYYSALVKLVSPKSRVIKRLGDIHLMYYTSGWLFKFLHFFEKLEWKIVDEVVPISPTMAEYVEPITRHSTTILDPVPAKPRAKLGHSVMFHGLLTKNKGVDILLKAAKLLPKRRFWIVGDGPDRKRLEKLAPLNVTFFGWVDDVYPIIERCGVGVSLRAKNQGNELVVTSPFLQYSVMGKPCIVSKRKVFDGYPYQFTTAEHLAYLIDTVKTDCRAYVLEHHEAEHIARQIQLLFAKNRLR